MKLDDFESVFRSAAKPTFRWVQSTLRRATVVTDMPAEASRRLAEQAKIVLRGLDEPHWTLVSGADWDSIDSLVGQLENADLVITYRHLLGRQKNLRYTLGSVLDTLTQTLPMPILVLPSPNLENFEAALHHCDNVMVVTDHLTGDDRLVNWGVAFTPEHGTLYLCHVEDADVFERYSGALARIPGIATESSSEKLKAKLLQMPLDYANTIATELNARGIQEKVSATVELGQPLEVYKRLLAEHDIDLLIMDTKDGRQLAMDGTAHALAVEICDRPLLLL